MRKPILAIDGPAGAGKSTVARAAAERLDFTYIDTGAMYRAVALVAADRGVAPDDEEALSALAAGLEFEFRSAEGQSRLFVDGKDVSREIRQPHISDLASRVSAVPGVRTALVEAQRRMGERGGVVMEGRDIGTVVFPDAEVKIFLDATPEERARRRREDLIRQGHDEALDQVQRDLMQRDRRDSTREVAPLRPAEQSIHLLTDGLTIEETIERVTALVNQRTER